MEKLGQINNNEYKSIVQCLWGQQTRRANLILLKEKEKVMQECSVFTAEGKKEKKRAVFLLCEERRKQLKMMLRRLKWFSTIICFCTSLKSLNQVRLYAELTKNLGQQRTEKETTWITHVSLIKFNPKCLGNWVKQSCSHEQLSLRADGGE